MSDTRPPVLLDQDGCLADFIGGAVKVHGITREALYDVWPEGEFDCAGAFGLAVRGREFTQAEFWEPINRTPGFWLGLDPLPWARELFDLCAEAAGVSQAALIGEGREWGSLYIVTSPSRCPGCVREKEDWLLKHFGLPHDRMIPTPHKELMAVRRGDANVFLNGKAAAHDAESCVLVDDYARNCDRFADAGGNAVLFPARWNWLHAYQNDPMLWVRPKLEQLTGN